MTEPSFWNRRFFLLIIVVTVWRIVFVYAAPLNLAPDEAYYWDWSRVPDWGYFSKPPMIAWINACSTRLLGHTVPAVRLPPVLLSMIGLVAFYALAANVFGRRVAFWASVVSIVMPGSIALSFIGTIDAPLACAWAVALWATWMAIEKRTAVGWWILSGILVGFGVLSKQMMIVFPFLLLLYLLLTPRDRALLCRPYPYLVLCAALIALLPVLLWNIQHGWVTWTHTLTHFSDSGKPGIRSFILMGEFVGSQFGLLTPVVYSQMVVLLIVFCRQFRRLKPSSRYLLLFSVPGLAVLLLLSLHQRIQPNWPLVFYPGGILLLCAWALGKLSMGGGWDRWRALFKWGVLVGSLFGVLTYASPWLIIATGSGGSRWDPYVRLRGWQQLAAQIDQQMIRWPEREEPFVVTNTRALASELAFYLRSQPRVFKWTSGGRITSQYDLWPGPLRHAGHDGFVVWAGPAPPPWELRSCFKNLRYAGDAVLDRGKGSQRTVSMHQGNHLLNWPQNDLHLEP